MKITSLHPLTKTPSVCGYSGDVEMNTWKMHNVGWLQWYLYDLFAVCFVAAQCDRIRY